MTGGIETPFEAHSNAQFLRSNLRADLEGCVTEVRQIKALAEAVALRADELCTRIAAVVAMDRVTGQLSEAVPSIVPQTRAEVLAAHRRAHRPGIPAKIDSDPELRAFILARLDTRTFTQICDEAAAHFPPDRRTSLSALSRWWQRKGQHLKSQSQNTSCS